ncbi:MAG: hypothetical protein IKE61_05980 [Coriobacteriales bacterium]|nr:hypothetical protein [Coriobacteriales bacterium]
MDPKKLIKKPFGKKAIEFYATYAAEDVATEIDKSLELIARSSGILFTPEDDLEAKIKETVSKEQFDALLQDFVMNRLAPFVINAEDNLVIATDPICSSNEIPKADKDFTFTIRVLIKPKVTLESYEPVKIKMPIRPITQEEIDQQFDQIIAMTTTYEPNDDQTATVELGDFIKINLRTFDDKGEELKGLTGDERLLQLDYGFMPKDFVNQIIGMKVGDSKEFEFKAPRDFGEENENTEYDIYKSTVEVLEFQHQVVPTLTDEFVKENVPGFDTYAELEQNIRNYVEQQHIQADEQYKSMLVDAANAERFKGGVDDEIYEVTAQNIVRQMRMQLSTEGKTINDFMKEQDIDEQTFNMQIMLQARDVVRQGFALDAIYNERFGELKDEDIDKAFKAISQKNPEDVKQDFIESGRWFSILEVAKRLKAHNWLMCTAEVETFEMPENPQIQQ